MKKYITLEFDITNKIAGEMREKYGTKSYSESPLVSSQYEGELLLPSEIDMCEDPDVNRFKIWGENACEVKTDYTGWIINKKIYTRKELIKMEIELPNDGERYFLTSERQPIEVKNGDEPAICFFTRIKKKLEEQKSKLEMPVLAVVEQPKVVVITEKPKRGYNYVNDNPDKRKYSKGDTTRPKAELVLSPDLYIKVQIKTNSANINKSTNYVKVKGKNITTDFNSDEVVAYFFDENVIRTRFFKHELTPDYDGKPHPGKEIYQSGWIYNGDAYDLEIAYGIGLISPSKAKEYRDFGASRIVITKCGYKFIMNEEDVTFDEYVDKWFVKEGLAKTKD